jgi:hypothetical protein
MCAPNLKIGAYEVVHYPSQNNYRLPNYHRLDVGLHYKTNNRFNEHNLSFDIFNVYNRKNPINVYYSFYSFNYSYSLPIIPTVTYTFKLK